MLSHKDITGLLLPVLQLAIQAGEAIMEVYRGDDFQVERKADFSPLTLADRRAHAVIDSGLVALDNVPVLSEEGRDIPWPERKHWDELWLVDPLDGTKEFIKQNGEFTVNIALVQKGEPVLGVIVAPARGVAYVGMVDVGAGAAGAGTATGGAAGNSPGVPRSRGEDASHTANRGPAEQPPGVASSHDAGTIRPSGASFPGPGAVRFVLDDEERSEPTQPNSGVTLDESELTALAQPIRSAAPQDGHISIIASRSHMGPRTRSFIRAIGADYDEVKLVHIGSSLKLCLLAEGSANIYPRNAPTMEWDTAAGHAILRAAGGEIWQATSSLRRPSDRGAGGHNPRPGTGGAGKGGPVEDDRFHGNGEPLVYNKRDLHNPHFVARGW